MLLIHMQVRNTRLVGNIENTFFNLFITYLKASTIRHPDIFGLKDFSPTELLSQGYELVGDPKDFHCYEKDYVVGYHNKKLSVVFKRYFYLDENAGSGLSIGRGASLISLLKCYKAVCLADGMAIGGLFRIKPTCRAAIFRFEFTLVDVIVDVLIYRRFVQT
ncbi:hypothetical protein U1R68_02585 [Pectobacterium colocasium]|uniref:hypothetical protein n=1 Tax=Pectobacterium TaxID=122277 RepID=UPI0021D7983D|nr:hypothetical protein [Pectobacterium sp. F1-1]